MDVLAVTGSEVNGAEVGSVVWREHGLQGGRVRKCERLIVLLVLAAMIMGTLAGCAQETPELQDSPPAATQVVLEVPQETATALPTATETVTPTATPVPPTATATAAPTPEPLPPIAAWPNDFWQTSTPEEQGVDSEILYEMLRWLPVDPLKGRGLVALLVIRHGYLIMDAYLPPYRPDLRTELYSCTKSVTGALVGIALEQGYIESLDQPVLDFFPDREIDYWDDRKLEMTIEDLLTMRTGWDWYEFGIDPEEPEAVFQRFLRSSDWVQFLLDRPQNHQPGTRYEYSTGASHLLAAIIQQATGKTALAYARENLFEPMGITDVDWFVDPQGVNSGGYGLTMRPPDMAKFGYLYLRNGEWDGRQIVPAEWVAASTFEHQHLENYYPSHKTGYGYQWWIFPGFNHYESDSYAAVGYKGQYIFVVPDRDMVVVFSQWEARLAGQASQRSPDSEIWYLQRFILHASKSDEPLPPNPEGLARLREGIEALSAASGGG